MTRLPFADSSRLRFAQALCLGWILALSSAAGAALPQTLNYQGRMADAGGPVPDSAGNTVIFRIFNALSGPSMLWAEEYSATTTTARYVATKNGLFNVILGQHNPINLPFDAPYFLQIEWFKAGVGYETLTPRQPLTMAPYAYRAKFAETAGTAVPLTLVAGGALVPFSSYQTGSANAIYAEASGATAISAFSFGAAPGIYGISGNGDGVIGQTNGVGNGMVGRVGGGGVPSVSGAGVYGSSPNANGYGLVGHASGNGGMGVSATATGTNGIGVFAEGSTGVHAMGNVFGLVASGPVAISASSSSLPIYGNNTLGGGFLPAILGEASGTGVGVVGRNTMSRGAGALGGTAWPDGSFFNGVGVHGVSHANNTPGVFGEGDIGVLGRVTRGAGNVGVLAQSTTNTALALRVVGDADFDGAGSIVTFNTYVSFTAGTNLVATVALPANWAAAAPYPSALLSVTNTGSGHGISGLTTQPGGFAGGGVPDYNSAISAGVRGFSSQTNSAGVVGYSDITATSGVGVMGIGMIAVGGFARSDVPGAKGGNFVADGINGLGIDASASNGTGAKIRGDGTGASITAQSGVGTAIYAEGRLALDASGAIDVRGTSSIGASDPSTGRIYFDGASNKFRVSESGGGYVDLVGGAVSAPLSLTLASGANSPLSVSNSTGAAGLFNGDRGIVANGFAVAVSATSSAGNAIYAQNSGTYQPTGYFIQGTNTAAAGSAIAVYGQARNSLASIGIFGYTASTAPTFPAVGPSVYGYSDSANTAAIWGRSTNGPANSYAVIAEGSSFGLSATASGGFGPIIAVHGAAHGTSNQRFGVMGRVNMPTGGFQTIAGGVGVMAENGDGTGYGLWARNFGGGGKALLAQANAQAISATTISGSTGAIFTAANSTGATIETRNDGGGRAVDAFSQSGQAIYGFSSSNVGIWGQSSSNNGILGMSSTSDGVQGWTDANAAGKAGVIGLTGAGTNQAYGVFGTVGTANAGNIAVLGSLSGATVPAAFNGAGAAGAFLSDVANGQGLFVRAAGTSAIGASIRGGELGLSVTAASTTATGISVTVNSVGTAGVTRAAMVAVNTSASGTNPGPVAIFALANQGAFGTAVIGRGGASGNGVLGSIAATSATVDGRAGIRALNTATSAGAGSIAPAIDIDGAIVMNTTRSDNSAGSETVSITTGAAGNAVINYGTLVVSTTAVKANSIILLTVKDTAANYAASTQLSAIVSAQANGSFTIRATAQNYTNVSPGLFTVTVDWLVINQR